MEKLEWCGYVAIRWWKKDMFIRFYRIHKPDRQMDTAWRQTACLHSIARQ